MQTERQRVVIFGCQKIAIDVIDYISKNQEFDVNIVHVVTCDYERDRLFENKFVSEYCNESDIPWTYFDGKVDSAEVVKWEPDIIFSIYYRKILPKEVVNMPKMGCINIHPARLPKDRGPNPTYWAVKRGDSKAFTTVHYIDEGMDTGDIITTKSADIAGMTGYEVNKLMMDVGTTLFKKEYPKIISKTNTRFKQDHGQATCNVAFVNNMRYVRWNMPARLILGHIRAHAAPYAGSLACTQNGTEIVINEAKILDQARTSDGPGSYNMTSGGLVVQTHDRPILITHYVEPCLKKGRFIAGMP